MTPPLPPEEIAPLMRFIAEKAKNVKSPMNVVELCRQFNKETGSLIVLGTLRTFLNELKKVADVKVDVKQRIIQYKQNDGGLELIAKNMKLSMDQGEQRGREIIQFLAEKSKTTDKPIADKVLVREFKEKSGYTDSIESLRMRYLRMKKTIHESSEIDKNTKIKMMFISLAKLTYEIFQELQKDAHVEVDEERRITKYKAIDGSLELEGDHSFSSRIETARMENKRQRIAAILKRKRAREVSEEDAEESMKVQNFDTKDAEYFQYNQPKYVEDMDHIPLKMKPKSLLEAMIEVPECPSTSIGGDHYFFDYDAPNNKEDTDHIPVEKKPENLIEVKTEVTDRPSTSSSECHYEANLEHILTEPKPEFFK